MNVAPTGRCSYCHHSHDTVRVVIYDTAMRVCWDCLYALPKAAHDKARTILDPAREVMA